MTIVVTVNYLKASFIRYIIILLFLLLSLPVAAADRADEDIFSLADELKGEIIWDPRSENGELRTGRYSYSFRPGVPFMVADSSEKVGSGSVYMKDGMLMVSGSLAEAVRQHDKVVPAQRAVYTKSGHRVAAIFIDPGHGGKDPGAIGTHRIRGRNVRVMEKTVVLNIGKKLKDMLSREYPDKKIIMSRTGDTFPSLDDRVRMANSIKLKPNESILFISVHANASLNKKANGFEVWCLPDEYRRSVVDSGSVDSGNRTLITALNTIAEEELSRESIQLAGSILDGMDKKISREIPNRGIKRESWFVVRNAKMPSVLIEVGFVSNPKEAELLNSNSYLQKISEGIYNGIQDFVYDFEHSE